MKQFTFNEIAHNPLKVYNRAVMTFNTLEDFGMAAAEDYLNQFTTTEKSQISLMIMAIRSKGKDVMQAAVTEGLEFKHD